MENPFQTQSLTEEQKCKVRKYFETGDKQGESEARLWYRYGKMRKDEKIEAPETIMKVLKEQKQAEYKRKVLADIDRLREEYRKSQDDERGEFEIVNYKRRENTDTLVLGIRGISNEGRPKTFSTYEVIQKDNPELFKQLFIKYRRENILATYQ